jgi:hypothetical protein
MRHFFQVNKLLVHNQKLPAHMVALHPFLSNKTKNKKVGVLFNTSVKNITTLTFFFSLMLRKHPIKHPIPTFNFFVNTVQKFYKLSVTGRFEGWLKIYTCA